MRVYEIAREHKLSSNQVLDLLQEGGFGTLTHMAALSDDALAFLNKAMQKKLLQKSQLLRQRQA